MAFTPIPPKELPKPWKWVVPARADEPERDIIAWGIDEMGHACPIFRDRVGHVAGHDK